MTKIPSNPIQTTLSSLSLVFFLLSPEWRWLAVEEHRSVAAGRGGGSRRHRSRGGGCAAWISVVTASGGDTAVVAAVEEDHAGGSRGSGCLAQICGGRLGGATAGPWKEGIHAGGGLRGESGCAGRKWR